MAAAEQVRTARTIGVAIAIPPPHGPALQQARASFGDPQAESIPTHVTLLPPTEVEESSVPEVMAHLRSAARQLTPFEIHLRGTGSFRPVSPVVFIQVAEGISACERVEQAVRSGPLARDLQFYYHPHVTVAHHLDDEALDKAYAALADFECRFTVDAFHLYAHGDDGVWRPEHVFSFGGAG